MKQKLKSLLKSSKLFEFLMIFAGITLSMQFDNWNEERKERIKEKEIVTSLYIDLLKNREDLLDVIDNFDHYFISKMNVIIKILQDEETQSKTEYKDLYFPLGGTYLDQNYGAFYNFKNNALLLRNNDLRMALYDYYDIQLKWVAFQQEDQIELGRNELIPIFYDYTNEKNRIVYEDYLSLRKNKKVIRRIIAWRNAYFYNKKVHMNLLPQLNKLIQLVESELVKLEVDYKKLEIKKAES